jgi:hypothetical protein
MFGNYQKCAEAALLNFILLWDVCLKIKQGVEAVWKQIFELLEI